MSSEKVEQSKLRLMKAIEQSCQEIEYATGVTVSGISVRFDRIAGLSGLAYNYRVTGLTIELTA